MAKQKAERPASAPETDLFVWSLSLSAAAIIFALCLWNTSLVQAVQSFLGIPAFWYALLLLIAVMPIAALLFARLGRRDQSAPTALGRSAMVVSWVAIVIATVVPLLLLMLALFGDQIPNQQ